MKAGDRLGPYEVLAKLGEGGMGEVYKARDTRLNRTVAIKVLPPEFSSDPDRRARFEREARVVAALSHPNILAIHDFGTEQGVAYAVTELLEGETLRQRLIQFPVPWRRAVGIAVQLADGLAAAHAKGIVHRDLKPENIFLTTSGPAKLLDFGLAHIVESGDGAATRTREAITEPGTVLGTVGYMSPEQVRGEEVGPASDIFAFGCVFYEMVTGRALFARPTPAETMSAILRDEPQPLAGYVTDVPREVETIILHCLEKRPEDRYQSAKDMGFALQTAGGMTPAAGPAGALPGGRRGARSRWLRWALPAVGLVAALAGIAVGVAIAPRAARQAPARYEPLTFRRGTVSAARFAPDGKTVVYSASWDGEPYQVSVKRPEGPDAWPTGPPGTHLAAVSRSGDLAVRMKSEPIAPFMSRGLLASLPLVGGAPRDLREAVVAADWSPDGLELATVNELGDRQRLELPRGTGSYETRGWISDLRYSPKGDLLAFIEHPSREDESGAVVVFDPRRGEKQVLAGGTSRRDLLGVAWSPDGREVWFGELGGLRAATLDGRERVVTEVPESIRLHDIASDGRVLLSFESRRVQVAARGPGADRERDLSWLTWSVALAIARDGGRVVFTEYMRQPGLQGTVAMRATDGSPIVRLGEGFATDLSPDGRWVAAIRDFEHPQIALLPTGAGEPRLLPRGGLGDHSQARFTPDGRRVVFAARENGRDLRLYVQAVAGGDPAPVSPEGIVLSLISMSPNGSFAVANWKDGRPWLFPLAGGEPRPLPGGQPGEFTSGWTNDGSGVYLTRLGAEVPIRLVRVRDGAAEAFRVLRASDPAGVAWIGPVVVAGDGHSYAYTYMRILSRLYVAEGLR